MHKALVLFLVPGIMAFAPVPEEVVEDSDAEVDHALRPFWDLLLAKVTLFSETWSQRIKEVMRSLAYPKGHHHHHHHKCPDHHVAHKEAEETKDEDFSAVFQENAKKEAFLEELGRAVVQAEDLDV